MIEVYDNTLSFIHLTAREFLSTDFNAKEKEVPLSNEQREWHGILTSHNGRNTLSRVCVDYLLLPEFATIQSPRFEQGQSEDWTPLFEEISIRERYPLLRFAFEN